MSKLTAVSKAFDWQTYVEQHHQYKPAWGSKGYELRICCPFCGEADYKCYINPSERLLNCFKCSDKLKKRDCFDFVAATEGIPRQQAVLRLLSEYKDVTPEEFASLEDSPQDKPLPVLKTVKLPEGAKLIFQSDKWPDEADEYVSYLVNRGLHLTEIKQMQTYYVQLLGKRVLWPIYGGDGQLVSWTARTIEDHDLKFKTADKSDAAKTLWPYIHPKGSEVVIVEGILDAVALRRLVPNVYATFGKKLSEGQISLLQSWGVTAVTLFWDRKDAKTEMKKTAKYLETRFSHVYLADVRDWPKDQHGEYYDTGDYLSHPALGSALKRAVQGRIKLDSVDFLSWELDG